jgi:hypothetical protein
MGQCYDMPYAGSPENPTIQLTVNITLPLSLGAPWLSLLMNPEACLSLTIVNPSKETTHEDLSRR